MSDLRQQVELLLAYMQVQQFQNAADAVHIILGRFSFLFLLAWFQLQEQTYNWWRLRSVVNERRQRSVNAVKALWAPWKHRESIVKAQSIANKNSEGTCESELRCNALVALRMPWQALFHEKYQIFLPISRRSRKLNNSVPTQWKRGLVWQGH